MKNIVTIFALTILLLPVTGCQNYIKELAPIHDVSIELTGDGGNRGAIVSITYGIPNSCYSFDNTKVTAISDGYDIAVWLKISDTAEACAQIYGFETIEVDLGRKFTPGETYTIRVNGLERKITINDFGEEDLVIKPAPIVSVTVNIAESFPPQVFVEIKGLLTDGCTVFNEAEVQRIDKEIEIAVTTKRPRDAVCIQVIGYFTHSVALGSDFVSGQDYVVLVNGHSTHFNIDSGVIEPKTVPDNPITTSQSSQG